MSIFQKIIDREVPADIVFEDDRAIAFRDIAPQAPVHILVVPKRPIVSVASAEESDRELLGHLMLVIRDVAREAGLESGGYRIVTNNGKHGGKVVDHLHFHVLGGRQMTWPPG